MKAEQERDGATERLSLRVIELDPQTDRRWETLMKQFPTSVVYQHPAWLAVLKEAYDYKPMHLACEDAAGQFRGILPLFSRRGLRTGRVCASLFDSPLAGPLAYDDQATAVLIQAAHERARAEHASRFEVKVPSKNLDLFLERVVGAPLYETYELKLPERADLLRFDSRIKWAVNKASRLGLHIRSAETISDLRAWYQLYLQTMRRLVAVPKPYRFFERAWHHLRPQGLLRLLLAEQVGGGHRRLVAGFLFLHWGQTISHTFTGWRREDQGLRPNDFLHWHAIRDACAQGFRCYDFGNVRGGDQGIIQFKSKWGAEAKMVYRYTYPTDSSRLPASFSRQASHNSAGKPKKSVVRQLIFPLWQRLPLPAIELAGECCHTLHYY